MMMLKPGFTRGPWGYNAESGEIYLDDGEVFPLVATVNGDLTSEAQAIADGHLIAAAPDMYEALQEIAARDSYIDASPRGNREVRYGEHGRIARAALSKASPTQGDD
jgi:hypothetical protein